MQFGRTISRAIPRVTMGVVVVILAGLAFASAGTGDSGATASLAGGSFGWVLACLAGTFALLGVLFVGVASRR